MALWCMKPVDYDKIDLFARVVPLIKVPHPRSRSASVSSNNSTVSNASLGSHSNASLDSKTKGANRRRIKFVLPQSPDGSVVRIQGLTEADLEARSDNRLRSAMVCVDAQRDIPGILADWPCTALRLSSILSPEACSRVFTDTDQLWTHFLHAFIIRKQSCRLRCLDLSGFVPSKAMIYTFLQLIPLLSFRYDLSKKDIFDRIVSAHGLKDASILQNLSRFLDNVMSHPVFKRGKRVQLPAPLEIILDYLPLSADKLSLYCWLMASSLYDVTNVFIKVRSSVFTYSETGNEFSSMDPLLPLEIFSNSTCVQDLEGLAVESVPMQRTLELLTKVLPRFTARGHKLQRLAIANTDADFCEPKFHEGILSVISKCSGLRRLDLSKSRISGLLGHILRNVSQPLEFLNVSHCCLNYSDLDAIFHSKHSRHLKDINFSNIYSSSCSACVVSGRDLNHNACLWPLAESAVVDHLANREDDTESDDVMSPRGGPSLDFWRNQTSISSPRLGHNAQNKHEEDRKLLETVFNELHCLSKLTILDLMTDKFGQFRVDNDCFQALAESLPKVQNLKQINIQEIPLWDDDIFAFIEVCSSIASLQSISLSRSKEAPTMQTEDRFIFWKRLHDAKNGKMLRTSIANFVDESHISDDDKSETASNEVTMSL